MIYFSVSLLNITDDIWPSTLQNYTLYCPKMLAPIIGLLKESLLKIHFHEGSDIKHTRNKV